MRRFNNSGLFHVKQMVNGSTIVGFSSRTITQQLLPVNYGIEFKLSDVPQFGTFSNVWDQYRINKVVVKFIPMANVNQTGSAFTANPGVMATVIDYDNGGVALTALDQYEQYPNCKIVPAVRMSPHTRIITPHINIGTQNQGGAILAATNTKKQWIDCAQPNIAHHGLKVYIDAYASAGSAQTWQVFATYYLSFKNVF